VERGFVLFGPRHIVPIPLAAEAVGIRLCLAGEPGNTVDNGHFGATVRARQLARRFAGGLQMISPASGTLDKSEQIRIH
jgi:hypothetical protein